MAGSNITDGALVQSSYLGKVSIMCTDIFERENNVNFGHKQNLNLSVRSKTKV